MSHHDFAFYDGEQDDDMDYNSSGEYHWGEDSDDDDDYDADENYLDEV